jgi:hypothetical protein
VVDHGGLLVDERLLLPHGCLYYTTRRSRSPSSRCDDDEILRLVI